MTDESSIHVAATSIIGVCTTIIGFFGIRLVGQVDENTKKLAAHELEDVGKYATQENVKDALDRVHDRLDVVSNDIKTLLQR